MPERSQAAEVSLAAPSDETQWQKYYRLRWQILRRPWGQPPGSEQDDLEQVAYHCLARTPSGEAIGTGRLHRTENNTGVIRYMAVAPDWRGRGIGQNILNYLENEAGRQGLRTLQLHAREQAIGFYKQQGYELVEKSHLLFGEIQHYLMQKKLLD